MDLCVWAFAIFFIHLPLLLERFGREVYYLHQKPHHSEWSVYSLCCTKLSVSAGTTTCLVALSSRELLAKDKSRCRNTKGVFKRTLQCHLFLMLITKAPVVLLHHIETKALYMLSSLLYYCVQLLPPPIFCPAFLSSYSFSQTLHFARSRWIQVIMFYSSPRLTLHALNHSSIRAYHPESGNAKPFCLTLGSLYPFPLPGSNHHKHRYPWSSFGVLPLVIQQIRWSLSICAYARFGANYRFFGPRR